MNREAIFNGNGIEEFRTGYDKRSFGIGDIVKIGDVLYEIEVAQWLKPEGRSAHPADNYIGNETEWQVFSREGVQNNRT